MYSSIVVGVAPLVTMFLFRLSFTALSVRVSRVERSDEGGEVYCWRCRGMRSAPGGISTGSLRERFSRERQPCTSVRADPDGSGSAPSCSWCPFLLRCARGSSCRIRPRAPVPSTRRLDRQSDRRAHVYKTRAGTERGG